MFLFCHAVLYDHMTKRTYGLVSWGHWACQLCRHIAKILIGLVTVAEIKLKPNQKIDRNSAFETWD